MVDISFYFGILFLIHLMYCILLEFKIVLEFVFALVSDHLPPNSPNIIIELKQKNSFLLTLCAWPKACTRKLPLAALWSNPLPAPTPPMTLPLTLLLMLCCQAVCVAGCAACLILLTYVISFLFPMGRKNNGFWSLSFFLVSIWKCIPMHIYMKFPCSSFSKTGQLSVNTWKWNYFLSTLVFVWPCSWFKVSVHFLSFFFFSLFSKVSLWHFCFFGKRWNSYKNPDLS